MNIPVNISHSIKPIEVEGEIYALKKGDNTFIPSKLAGAMIKRGWAAKIPKPERLGDVEGAEVRDVTRWVKGITGEQISRLKIGKNGLAISFVDTMNTTAGKVYTPFYSSVNNNDIKEAGYSAGRLAKIFDTFKRGEKARLWWKGDESPKLFIKEEHGNLSWRHNLPNLEEAAKIPNLKKIPLAAIKMDIKDVASVATLNKGKRVADKYGFVAFYYCCKKVIIYAIHEERYSGKRDITKLKELEAIEGEGEGIAIYRLEYVEKLLKGAKRGIVRIGEDAPLKVLRGIGKESKAVAFLTPVVDEDLKGLVAGLQMPPSKTEEDNRAVEKVIEKEAVKLRKEIEEESKEELGMLDNELKEEEIVNGTAPKVYTDMGWAITREGTVGNPYVDGYKRGVKLEQNGSFFRIAIYEGMVRGYTTEAEAVKKYEWLTEVW